MRWKVSSMLIYFDVNFITKAPVSSLRNPVQKQRNEEITMLHKYPKRYAGIKLYYDTIQKDLYIPSAFEEKVKTDLSAFK